jgi:nicotinamidase/pyrazinamidase
VVVDVQNDFVNGSLAVPGAVEIMRPLAEVDRAVSRAGGNNVKTGDQHPADTPHFDKWPIHCVEGTDGAYFYSALKFTDDDFIISKGMEQADGYSAWEGFDENGATLETIIMPRTPEEKVRVFIGGLATDYCVKATTIDVRRHFSDDARVSVYVLRDAIRAVNIQPNDGAEALQAMVDAGAIAITSQEALALIAEGM